MTPRSARTFVFNGVAMGNESEKGRFPGQMAPFTREDLQLIRAKLKAQEAWRDVALLNVRRRHHAAGE